MNEWSMNKFVTRKAKASVWVDDGNLLTKFASEQHAKTLVEASRRSVRFPRWIRDGSEIIANVSKASSPHISVNLRINSDDKKIECTCRFFEDTGMVCFHAAALMAREERLDSRVTTWYEDRYHSEHYLQCYSVDLPSLAIDRKFSVEELLPPEHKVTGGRPRSERYVSTSSKKKICRGCGMEGHNQATCPNPSTKVRWENYREEAMEWAQSYTSYLFHNK